MLRSVHWAAITYVIAILLYCFFTHNIVGAFLVITIATAIYGAILGLGIRELGAQAATMYAAQAALISPVSTAIVAAIVRAESPPPSLIPGPGVFKSPEQFIVPYAMSIVTSTAIINRRVFLWAHAVAIILLVLWVIRALPRNQHQTGPAILARVMVVLVGALFA